MQWPLQPRSVRFGSRTNIPVVYCSLSPRLLLSWGHGQRHCQCKLERCYRSASVSVFYPHLCDCVQQSLWQPCGGANVYCPAGSGVETSVPVGYYSSPEGEDPTIRQAASQCPPGAFCISGVKVSWECHDGGSYAQPPEPPRLLFTHTPQALCHPGRWSNATGATSACTQLCAPGYACPSGSVAADGRPCGAPDLYCPEGAEQPLVSGPGRYTFGGFDNGTTRTSAGDCPSSGVYCPGSGYTIPCAPGFYGNDTRLSNSSCSGACAAGFYCPSGSVTATAQPCGSAAVYVESLWLKGCESYVYLQLLYHLCTTYMPVYRSPPPLACVRARYCPVQSARPVPVPTGSYSTPEASHATVRSQAQVCPAGHYCTLGQRAPCPPGRFTTETGMTTPCYLCPSGESQP